VVKDRQNGRLISRCDLHEFARGLAWVASLSSDKYQSLRREATKTARDFSATSSAERMLSLYESVIRLKRSKKTPKSRAMRLLYTERRVFSSILRILLRSVCLMDVAPKKLAYLPVQDQASHFSAISRPGFAPRILGLYYACAMRLRLASLHIEAEGMEELDKKIESRAPILVIFWHGKYVPLFALFAGRRACIFSSRSFRGEVISEICHHFGYVCILIPEHLRESALKIMSQALAHYRVGATAADGPSGPPRRIKPGLLNLASELGHAVIPVSVASSPKRIKKHRWDRMEYPCFRSHVYLVVGDEIIIPPGLKQSEYDKWMHRLKEILDDTDRQAEERLMVCVATDPINSVHGTRNYPKTDTP
jgi:lysophospholipid acyltransferase (LPLAT)-like uncharacterized protein